ncbi:MAG: DoxX family protein, partial [Pseudolabrys sp.]
MVGSNDEPKLLLTALKPFYDFVIPLSWFVVRAAAGWNLLIHSWGKITVGPASGFLKAFVDIGFTPPAPWFWTALFTETLAGIALILGLFTRFFAAAAAIPLLIIT